MRTLVLLLALFGIATARAKTRTIKFWGSENMPTVKCQNCKTRGASGFDANDIFVESITFTKVGTTSQVTGLGFTIGTEVVSGKVNGYPVYNSGGGLFIWRRTAGAKFSLKEIKARTGVDGLKLYVAVDKKPSSSLLTDPAWEYEAAIENTGVTGAFKPVKWKDGKKPSAGEFIYIGIPHSNATHLDDIELELE